MTERVADVSVSTEDDHVTTGIIQIIIKYGST